MMTLLGDGIDLYDIFDMPHKDLNGDNHIVYYKIPKSEMQFVL